MYARNDSSQRTFRCCGRGAFGVRMNIKRCGMSIILVVEDEPAIRLMIADALRENGFEVIEAGTADEAILVVGSATPVDLVFTDYRLPGSMDGVALVKWLRQSHPE